MVARFAGAVDAATSDGRAMGNFDPTAAGIRDTRIVVGLCVFSADTSVRDEVSIFRMAGCAEDRRRRVVALTTELFDEERLCGSRLRIFCGLVGAHDAVQHHVQAARREPGRSHPAAQAEVLCRAWNYSLRVRYDICGNRLVHVAVSALGVDYLWVSICRRAGYFGHVFDDHHGDSVFTCRTLCSHRSKKAPA